MSDETSKATALVVLPFADEEKALLFTNLVYGQMPGVQALVTRGTAQAYVHESGEEGQVIEMTGWEAFEHAEDVDTVVLHRVTKEAD